MTDNHTNVICPYCNSVAEWVSNDQIYGRRFGRSYMAWLCRKCNAYVGCHNNTHVPLGTMANSELREYRKAAHALIDPIWQKGPLKRKHLYVELSRRMGHQVHVAWADVDECREIMRHARELKADMGLK